VGAGAVEGGLVRIRSTAVEGGLVRIRSTAVLGLVALLALAACGGDDDDGAADTGPAAASPAASATTGATPTSGGTGTATTTAASGSSSGSASATPAASRTTAATPTTEAAPVLPAEHTNPDGTAVTVEDTSRIVVANGDLAEVVFALGLGDLVVATDVSATYPPEAAARPKIGYQRTLNAEGILAQQPSLVLADENAGPPEVLAQVRDAGVPVVVTPIDTTLAGPGNKIRAVATALGVPERGEALAASVEESLEEAAARVEGVTDEPRVIMLYLRGAGTQIIMGQGTGFDSLVNAAGAIDAASDVRGTAPITPEALVAAAPDVIVVTTTGLESVGGIDGLLQIPGIAQTPAGAERRVLDYDDQLLLGFGPRTGEMLATFITDLHPNLA
jgi:iron complex transport system substrate-binding protein